MVSILELFTKKSSARVLEFFLDAPAAEIHASALAKRKRMSKKAALDALEAMSSRGIVKSRQMGRAIYYSLEKGNPTVKALKRLLTISSLRQALVKADVQEVDIYLFGSAARGEDTERSDVDVLVIGDEGKRRDRALFAALGGERIRIAFFTPMEFSMLSRKDRPFYDAIERDKVRLL